MFRNENELHVLQKSAVFSRKIRNNEEEEDMNRNVILHACEDAWKVMVGTCLERK